MSPLHLDAGKYAIFVWPAYGATLIAFAWMVIDTLARSRRWRREVERLEKDRQTVRWLAAILPILALAALVAIFATRSLHRDPQVVPKALVGRPLPAVSLPALAGGAATPMATAAKGPVLVNFYASWCVPCVEEAPALMALKAEGVPIVGVAYKDTPDKTAAFLQRWGDPYSTVLIDADGRAGVEFGTTGVPETYAVNAAGVIVGKHAGALTADDAETLLQKAGR